MMNRDDQPCESLYVLWRICSDFMAQQWKFVIAVTQHVEWPVCILIAYVLEVTVDVTV